MKGLFNMTTKNTISEFMEKGQIFKLHKSKKNGNFIAYTTLGKVILIKNQNELHHGFAKITSFVDKGNYFLATMENVPFDFYYGYENDEVIPYDEFKEVLKMLDFTQEYTENIDENNIFDIWANLNTGTLVTIETWNKDGEKSYNSVNVYIPTGNTLAFGYHNIDGFSHGGYNVCCFNLVNNKMDFPLRNILSYSSNSKNWNGEHPSLWHYGEGHDLNFAKILSKIYNFNDDIATIFNMKIEEAFKRYAENGYIA